MWERLVRRVRIDWRGFAVTRGGFFDWGRPAEYEPWPGGVAPAPEPALTAGGGFCAPFDMTWSRSGWDQWREWYCAHSWRLADALPMLSVERGAVRYA